jgi:hypothetical protein
MISRQAIFGLFILFLSLPAWAVEWFPIEKSELARTKPKLDPDAPAEVSIWDVRIEDRLNSGTDLQHLRTNYLRIKIYTEAGRDKYGKVELSHYGKSNIINISGRTIKPDGTIIDLKKDAVFDRVDAKTKRFRARSKSFALPDVKVGDVIEYQWLLVQDDAYTFYEQLEFQREIPVLEVTYHLKPLSFPGFGLGMRGIGYNCKLKSFTDDGKGFFSTGQTNMPAYVEEPRMPPEDAIKAWALVYYEEDKKLVPEKFWGDMGKKTWETYKPLMKANKEIKRKAEEITASAGTPLDKVVAIEDFVRANIKNVNHDSSGLTSEQRTKFKPNKDPSDTLAQGMGTGTDANLLFASLVNAVGIDARMANIPDRGSIFFNPNYTTRYHMRAVNIAVMIDGKWKFFDPATPYVESGMLRWGEEGVRALISDPKEGFFVETQFSPPVRSATVRRGRFKLEEDGTLTGLAQLHYKGHVSVSQKNHYDGMSEADRNEELKKELTARFPDAEIQSVKLNNISDPKKQVEIAYRLKIPGYATRTGKRILLEPCFFERGIAAQFKNSKRVNPIYFPYAFMEDDEVAIEIPDGWDLDNPMVPGAGQFGLGEYKVNIVKSTDGRTIVYRRVFDWGRDMRIVFPAENYEQLKKIHDYVYEQDHHVLSLRQSTGKAATENE